MLRSYLLVAWRSLARNRLYGAISTIGLAAGMACAALIGLWVCDQLGYDRFHEHADRLYRVVRRRLDNPAEGGGYIIPNALPPYLARTCPAVQAYTRIHRRSEQQACAVSSGQTSFYEPRFYLADASLFQLFSFPFTAGDPATALASLHSMVLTEETAVRYFGDAPALGRTLRLDDEVDLVVTGVVRLPHNSHLQFDLLARLEWLGSDLDTWYWQTSGYVLLAEGASPAQLAPQMAGAMQHSPQEIDHRYRVELEPVAHIHLHERAGEAARVYVLGAVAVLVLALACANSVNLTLAQQVSRVREVGLRRVVGATRAAVARQLVGESVLFALVAAVVAAALVELALPHFRRFTGSPIELDASSVPWVGGVALLLAVTVGLAAGAYPAWVASSWSSARSLGGRHGRGAATPAVRRALVIGQFAASMALVVCALVMRSQHQYLTEKRLGFSTEQVLYLPMNERLLHGYEAYRSDLLLVPGVVSVALASSLPFDVRDYHFVEWPGKSTPEQVGLRFAVVDPDYVRTLGINLVEGRDFRRGDPAEDTAFLVNRRAVAMMGLASPVGTQLTFQGLIRGKVVGVIDDYHIRPLSEERGPLLLTVHPDNCDYFVRYLLVRIGPTETAGTLAAIEQVTRRHAPGRPFEYGYLDAAVERLYREVQQTGRVLSALAVVGVCISGLGLAGLASCLTRARRREIGVRKVLGGSAAGLAVFLVSEFLRWVLVAVLLAWTVAYWAMHRWLQGYAYRMDLPWWPFLTAAAGAAALAVLGVGAQTVRAALANPVEALRWE
ncbi:MAG: ABC transporter permease [Candidatus Latescibacterota bacterium]